jgi:secondary thiamine-phosphate synthase enzyme
MAVITENISISTSGYCDIIDITPQLSKIIDSAPISAGIVTVFVAGSTAGITTIEFEPGLLKDLPEAFERLASAQQQYHHDATWGDGNGFSHVRAALLGPSITIPFRENRMTLGTWQQVVVIDFDNTSRKRNIIIQIMGE